MKIRPSDIVLHKPSGEKWVVCGVNREQGRLIPCGYPFPTVAKIEDCELIEERYTENGQPEEYIKALKKHGYESYIDPMAPMFHGFLEGVVKMAEYIEPAWCEECDNFCDSDMGGEGRCREKDEPTWYGAPACGEFVIKGGK